LPYLKPFSLYTPKHTPKTFFPTINCCGELW
jgi:hypothetical protein